MGALQPKPEPAPGRQTERLESWKEIAAYLRRTVRTVQRWERDQGLPVHRQNHEQRDSVYGLVSELDQWLAERHRAPKNDTTQPQPHAQALAKPRRWPIYVLAAVIAASLALGALAHYWTASQPVLPFAARNWVVLADFDNQTGDSNLDHGLGLAFQVSLEQSRHTNLLPESQVTAALRRMGGPSDRRIDDSVAREIAVREGAKAVILPAVSRVGGVYALSAKLVDVKTGETVAAFLERAGRQDQILDTLGRLAARIRRGLGESLASIHHNDKPLPQVTTRSLEALRAYAEAGSAWKRGNYARGLEMYAAALRYDPDFAMARAALGHALLSHVYNRSEEGKAHFERARQLGERVTEKERLAIEANYHAMLGHLAQASDAYRACLAAYPDDVEIRNSFAYFLMRNGREEDAIAQYLEVLRALPGDSSALVNIAAAYKNLSRPADSVLYYEKAFALENTWIKIASITHEYGFALAAAGNRAKAREVFSAAGANTATKAGGLRSLGLLSMLEGRYRLAATELKEAIGVAEANREGLAAARTRLFLVIVSVQRGDRKRAAAELDRARLAVEHAKDAGFWLPARIGMMYARTGAPAGAEKVRDWLRPKADPQSAADRSELRLLEGEIALAKGDPDGAVRAMEAARREKDGPLALAALARVYDSAGRTDQALETYEQLISSFGAAAGWEPQQDALEAYVRVGELYLNRKNPEKAAEALEPMVKLWDVADPDLPLAARIARILAALRPSPAHSQ